MDPTTNEALLDALVRHQTYLLRYSAQVRNKILAVLDRSEEDLRARILSKLAAGTGVNTPVELRRLEALVAALTAIRVNAWEQADAVLFQEMADLAYQEPIILQGIIDTTAPVVVGTVLPTANTLRAIATAQPFQGRVLKEWAASMRDEDLRRIRASVQLGMVAGESAQQISRRVVGTGALSGKDGVTELTRRQVDAITRTAVQHVANSARNEFFKQNSDIVSMEQFVATLDSRTTPVCKANDGKKYPLGKGPIPPLHFSCRSLRVAALDGERLGTRPAKPTTEKMLLREYGEQANIEKVTNRNDLPKGHKAKYDTFARKRIRELIGPVPAASTYQTWLEKQSKEFQDDTLGKTKAQLFRNGGLTLDKFVAANGTELTLSQLAKQHAAAFRAAGLDPQSFL